jgi:hypothetical protein
LARCIGHAISFTSADIRISRFEPRSDGGGSFHVHAGEFTQSISKSSQQTEALNPESRYC